MNNAPRSRDSRAGEAMAADAGMIFRSAPVVLATMCLGVLVAQLDSSVVNLALKQIGADLGGGVSTLQWVLDSYNLVYASLLLTGGALGDLYGRRRIFALGMVLFMLGSLVCGLAPGTGTLIAGRSLAGVGAALVLPTSLAILAVVYPDSKERARAIGIWASCNGLALAIGPTIGGLLVDTMGWRSIFLLIVPLCALALFLAWRAVPESSHPEGRQLDLAGQALSILGLGLLAFVVIEGPQWGWGSAPIVASVAVCVLCLALFVAVERGSEGAMVPLELFRRSGLSVSLAVAALMTFGMYGMLFLLPVYLQSARGHSAFLAGTLLLPLSLTFLLVSINSGRLATRFGARAMMTGGMASMGAGLLMLTGISADSPLWVIIASLFIIGVGLGLNTGPVMTVAVGSVPPSRAGTASGLVNTARIVGATLGVAGLGAVFAAHTGQEGGDAADIAGGIRAAFLVGAVGEFLGALIALVLIRRDAMQVSP